MACRFGLDLGKQAKPSKSRCRGVVLGSLLLLITVVCEKSSRIFCFTQRGFQRLLRNPEEWVDHRVAKAQQLKNPEDPDFTHTQDDQKIWLNKLEPEIVDEIAGIPGGAFADEVDDQQQRTDFREGKESGSINPKHTDSKNQDGASLWIDSKPSWVDEEKLKTLTQTQKGSSSKKKLWQSLLQNQQQWTDFREGKESGSTNLKHPDFKNQDGASLWINRKPSWVDEEKLKTLTQTQKGSSSKEKLWQSLLQNQQQRTDFREGKESGSTNLKHPDFKNQDGASLWIDSKPSWVDEEKLKTLTQIDSGSKDPVIFRDFETGGQF